MSCARCAIPCPSRTWCTEDFTPGMPKAVQSTQSTFATLAMYRLLAALGISFRALVIFIFQNHNVFLKPLKSLNHVCHFPANVVYVCGSWPVCMEIEPPESLRLRERL